MDNPMDIPHFFRFLVTRCLLCVSRSAGVGTSAHVLKNHIPQFSRFFFSVITRVMRALRRAPFDFAGLSIQ
jgi:hypothetical protein